MHVRFGVLEGKLQQLNTSDHKHAATGGDMQFPAIHRNWLSRSRKLASPFGSEITIDLGNRMTPELQIQLDGYDYDT